MLATALLSHDAISQKRTETSPSDAGSSAVPTVQVGAPQKQGVIRVNELQKRYISAQLLIGLLLFGNYFFNCASHKNMIELEDQSIAFQDSVITALIEQNEYGKACSLVRQILNKSHDLKYNYFLGIIYMHAAEKKVESQSGIITFEDKIVYHFAYRYFILAHQSNEFKEKTILFLRYLKDMIVSDTDRISGMPRYFELESDKYKWIEEKFDRLERLELKDIAL